MHNLNQKIAIVSSGGGMRCVYAAGVYTALAKEFGFTSPEMVVSTSGSAGSAAYYLAGQFDDIKKIWIEHLSSPEFISFMRPWRILDVNHLIDVVFKKKVPLHADRLSSTSTGYHIPVLHARGKGLRYISNGDDLDIFEVLRAAKALPFFYGQTVDLDGERYLDGGIGLRFEDTIEYARKLGATRIIAIDARRPAKRSALRMAHRDDDLILVSARELDVNLVTKDARKLRAGFELGYRDALRHQQLQTLLH